MKNKLAAIFAINVFVIVSAMGQNSVANYNDSQYQITKMLKSFYTGLAEICSEMELNLDKIDSLKKLNCTKNYYRFLEKQGMLDYDPLVKGQVFGLEYLNTLTIRMDPVKKNLYYVSFIRPYNKEIATIKLIIARESKSYKIDSVYLD